MDLKTIMAASMSVSEKFNISFTVILTGFVVVFAVLILLIFIIAVSYTHLTLPTTVPV